LRLAVALRAHGVAHLHSPWANRHAFVAMIAVALAKIPYSVQARAYDVHREAALALDDKLAHAAFVITNPRYNAEILRPRLPRARRPPLHVIHNGIDLGEFPAAPPPFGAPGRCRLLFVGRLVEQKGIEYLLRACRTLAAAGRSFSCTVVGDRTATQIHHGIHLRKLVRSLGLEEVVAFVGPRPADQVVGLYASADLVVLPCVVCADGSRDVTPNVLLEAMAMCRPVVSTAITGIPVIVVHEETGLLVPPRDAEALAAAIARIMDAPALGRELGNNGRARVEALFDVGRNIAAYRALFTPRVGTPASPPLHRASAGFRAA
jgi:glycosyltransferase involved in cell wall biosynthesis